MSSIPLPALRLRHPKFEGPLDQYRKVVQLRSLLGRQQFNQVQLQRVQAAQQGEQQAAALNRQVDDLIANASGDIRAALPKIRALSPQHWQQWKGWFADYDKKDAEAKMAAIDLGTKRSAQMAQLSQGIYDQASRDAAIQKGLRAQLIDEPTAQRWLSTPYDPDKIKALQKSALTTQQFLTHERNRLNAERQQQQDARNAPEKVYDFLARTMGTVRSQSEWTAKRNFAQARLRKMGVSEDYMDLIEEEYSPEAAQQVKQLGIEPKEEKKPTTPFAAFASGDPEEQKLARQWIALQNRYRRAMEDEGGLTANQKRQVDSINSRFNREMEVIKAQIQFDQPTEEQTRRMEQILRKTNEAYDAVVGGKAPKERAQAGKTAMREEVEAFAQSKGISYQEAARQLRAEGYTIQ